MAISNSSLPKPFLRVVRRVNVTYGVLKRLTDLVLAALLLPVFLIPMLLVAILVKLTSRGPAVYWSDRIGLNNRVFRMPKFRTMNLGAPEVATHLLDRPESQITKVGAFLRKTSLDELPQLFSILIGDLSFVGPRPALYNQHDLIALRTKFGIHELAPGLTGWAQIHGRDELNISTKVIYDYEYLQKQSYGMDLKILFLTLWSVLRRDGISH
ncbi:MAG TPA: sugar transferase [Dongiaceae bacterium]|nr:sugar transferase [Dongiaceae bacterium]